MISFRAIIISLATYSFRNIISVTNLVEIEGNSQFYCYSDSVIYDEYKNKTHNKFNRFLKETRNGK